MKRSLNVPRSDSPHLQLRRPRSRVGQRGMTLVEVMIVVAMIGVMAAVAVAGYSKYVDWARVATTKDIVNSITMGEEAYYADTLGYLECSPSGNWDGNDIYPMPPNSKKHHFHNPSHTHYACWRMLHSTVPEPTYASFMVKAGAQGTSWEALPAEMNAVAMDDATQQDGKPWYIVIAIGDQDEDGDYSYFMTHSGNPGFVHIENEDE